MIDWQTVGSVVFGGVIGAAIAYVFYKRAGDELKEESAKLRKQLQYITRRQDAEAKARGDKYHYFRDDEGDINAVKDVKSAPVSLLAQVRRDQNADTIRGESEDE